MYRHMRHWFPHLLYSLLGTVLLDCRALVHQVMTHVTNRARKQCKGLFGAFFISHMGVSSLHIEFLNTLCFGSRMPPTPAVNMSTLAGIARQDQPRTAVRFFGFLLLSPSRQELDPAMSSHCAQSFELRPNPKQLRPSTPVSSPGPEPRFPKPGLR